MHNIAIILASILLILKSAVIQSNQTNDNVAPNAALTMEQSLRAQLEFLHKGDMRSCFAFASPINKASIGPFTNFETMIRSKYSSMMNYEWYKEHDVYYINPSTTCANLVFGKGSRVDQFEWCLSRQPVTAACPGCWMTDRVVHIHGYTIQPDDSAIDTKSTAGMNVVVTTTSTKTKRSDHGSVAGKHKLEPGATLTWEQALRAQLHFLQNGDVRSCFAFASPKSKKLNGPLENFVQMFRVEYGSMIDFQWYKQRDVYYYTNTLTCASLEFGKGSRVNQFEWCLSKQPATADCPGCWMTENVDYISAYTVAIDYTVITTKATTSPSTNAITTQATSARLSDASSVTGKKKLLPSGTLTWEETLQAQLHLLHKGDVRGCLSFASAEFKLKTGSPDKFEKAFRAGYSSMINSEWHDEHDVYYYSSTSTCVSVVFGKGSRVDQFEWCLSQQPAVGDCPGCWMTDSIDYILTYTIKPTEPLTSVKTTLRSSKSTKHPLTTTAKDTTTGTVTPKDLLTTAETPAGTGVSTRGEGTDKHHLVPSATLTWDQVLRAQVQSLHEGDVGGCFAFASPKNKAVTGPVENFERMIRHSYSTMLNFEWFKQQDIPGHSSLNSKCVFAVFGKGSRVDQFEWCLSKQPATADCPGCWMTDNVVLIHTYTIEPEHPVSTDKATTHGSTNAKSADKHHLVPSATLTWEQVLQAQLQLLHEGDVRGCFAFASPENKAATGPVENFERMIRESYSSMLDSKWFMDQKIFTRDTPTLKCAFVLIGKGSSVDQFKWCLSKQPATADCPGCWMTDKVVKIYAYSVRLYGSPKHIFDTTKATMHSSTKHPLTTSTVTPKDLSITTRGKDTRKHHLMPSATLTWKQVVHAQLQSLHEGDVEGCFAFASPKNKAVTGPLENFERMIRHGYSTMLNFEWYVLGRELMSCGASDKSTPTTKCALVMIGKGESEIADQFYWELSKQPATADCPGCWMTESVATFNYRVTGKLGPKHTFDTTNTATGMEETKTKKDHNSRHDIKSQHHHHHDHAEKHHDSRHSHQENKDKEDKDDSNSKHTRHHDHHKKHHQHHHNNDFDYDAIPMSEEEGMVKHQQTDGGDHFQIFKEFKTKRDVNNPTKELVLLWSPLIGVVLMTLLLGLIICCCCILKSRVSGTVAPMPSTEDQGRDQEHKKKDLVELNVDVIGAPVQDDVKVIGKAITDDDVVLVVGRSVE